MEGYKQTQSTKPVSKPVEDGTKKKMICAQISYDGNISPVKKNN